MALELNMRDIIPEILNEEHDFTAERGPLSFSCDEIVCETMPDRTLHGTFDIYADETVRGFVFSQDLRVVIDTPQFHDRQAQIRYTIDSSGMPYDSVCSGVVAIVSDHGEYEIPYRIVVADDQATSSLGEIRNLFHFANLAQANWQEAAALFYSRKFPRVLGGNDAMYLTAYRGYAAVPDNMQNMENFLEVTRKKTRPSYRADVEEITLELTPRDYMAHVNIVREGWGYTRLWVEAHGDFLEVEQEQLSEEDFRGNVAELSFRVYRERLCLGENQGEILVYAPGAQIRIPVSVRVPVADYRDEERRLVARLMHAYIDYRIGRKSRHDWIRECTRMLVPQVEAAPERLDLRLYQVQLLLAEKRWNEAQLLLEQVEERLMAMGDETGARVEMSAYCDYLRSLLEHSKEHTAELAAGVEEMYRSDEGNWRLAWILLYMDGDYLNNERKCYRLLQRQYAAGCSSPLLYLEAVRILTKDPQYLESLDDYELSVYTFAMRHGVTTAQVRRRFAFLAGQERGYSEEVCRLLIAGQEIDHDIESLEAIVTLLMRGNCTRPQDHAWYAAAVERELRLPKLYEYYMLSADLADDAPLPRMLLMYFAYRSGLDTEHNAYLYANVLRHRSLYQEVYDPYQLQVEAFAIDQLLRGRVDDNLAYLYRKLGLGAQQEEDVRDAYTKMLFTWRIRVEAADFVSVVVVYEHLEEESVTPIYQGEAYLQIYSEQCCILLEDAEGNRYSDTSLYERERMLREHPTAERILAGGYVLGQVLYLAEESGETLQVDEAREGAYAWLSAQEGVTESYRRRLMIALTEYYFDNDLIGALDDMLVRFRPLTLSIRERETCLRILVARGLYEDAYAWILQCGTEGVDYKIQVRLCDRLLAHSDREYSPEMVKICQGILVQGKYDEDILDYLLRYGQGLLRERKELWRAADSFGMDVHSLIEQMMLQVLFTGVRFKEKTDIYLEHADKAMSAQLEQAYLARLSYDYFLRQEDIPARVFARVPYLESIGERILTICVLAYLRTLSGAAEAGELDKAQEEEARRYLARMRGEGIFLPFFTAFSALDARCRALRDMSYIEYRGKPGSRVVLHYVRTEGAQEPGGQGMAYRREEMRHVYSGIYVRPFLLYYGERVHYYITEEDGRQEKLTRSSMLEYTEKSKSQPEDRFAMVNHIAAAWELGDEVTLRKLGEEYLRKSGMTDRLFVQI